MHAAALWGFMRRLRNYEPGLFEIIENLVLNSPAEQVRAMGQAQERELRNSTVLGLGWTRADMWDMLHAFDPCREWRLFEWAGVVAGPCPEQQQGWFSFLMHGPKHSAFYKEILKVSVCSLFSDMNNFRESTCMVTRWPSGAPIWHANNAISGLFEFYDPDSFLVADSDDGNLISPAVCLHAFVMRLSCVLAKPNPSEYKFDIELEERDGEFFDMVDGELTDEAMEQTLKVIEETPLPEALAAPNIWFACQQMNRPQDYYIEAVQFNRSPRLANLELYIPKEADLSIPDSIAVPVRVLMPRGLHDMEASNTSQLREAIASRWGYMLYGCTCLAHHGREINGPLAQLGVRPGDVLVAVQKEPDPE